MQFRPFAVAISSLLLATPTLAAELITGLGGPAGFGEIVEMDAGMLPAT